MNLETGLILTHFPYFFLTIILLFEIVKLRKRLMKINEELEKRGF